MAAKSKEVCTDRTCIQIPNITTIKMDIEYIKKGQDKLEQSFTAMAKHNEEIGNKRDEAFKEFMKDIKENFVTKDEHKQVEKRTENLEGILSKLAWLVIGGVVMALLALILK